MFCRCLLIYNYIGHTLCHIVYYEYISIGHTLCHIVYYEYTSIGHTLCHIVYYGYTSIGHTLCHIVYYGYISIFGHTLCHVVFLRVYVVPFSYLHTNISVGCCARFLFYICVIYLGIRCAIC